MPVLGKNQNHTAVYKETMISIKNGDYKQALGVQLWSESLEHLYLLPQFYDHNPVCSQRKLYWKYSS